MTVKNSHEPNMRGHDCQSMGKLESIIGHLALMVSRMLYVMSPSSEILVIKVNVYRGHQGHAKHHEV